MSNRHLRLLYAHLFFKKKEKEALRLDIKTFIESGQRDKIEAILPQIPPKHHADVMFQIEKATTLKHHIIHCLDVKYPSLLLEIYDFPLVLYCRGNVARLNDEYKIAMIGTRKPTFDAIKMCDVTTRYLSRWAYTVVSGLAFGVDALAHRGALAHRCPTIAVLATPVDQISPKSNLKLALQILKDDGLIISEYPYGSTLNNAFFVMRNRIISGLCESTFIVEAGLKSGSLTTANHALDQNRTLYVMPGSISNKVATGTNWLLKQGAIPVVEPEDLIEELKVQEPPCKDKVNSHPIIQCLYEEGDISLEKLSTKLNLSINILLSELTLLECDGTIQMRDQIVMLAL